MFNYLIKIEYDGTNFVGWQTQKNGISVQGKIEKALKWSPRYSFEQGLSKTISWYLDHQDWVKNITSGAYQDYYERQYG